MIEGINSNHIVPELIKFIRNNAGCTKEDICGRFNYSVGPIGRRLVELCKENVIEVRKCRFNATGCRMNYYFIKE